MKTPKLILPIIVFSQFCCTSLWFAGNGVINDLVFNFNLSTSAVGNLTSAVQFGFILGTLVFAFFTLADRFSPSNVFFICAVVGALANLLMLYKGNVLESLLGIRFFTGFFLAGIYPIGMKIAADYYEKGLGKSLGFLVGALVLGTAFPHLLKGFSTNLPWRGVIVITSCIAFLGGILMQFFVADGPYRKKSLSFNYKSLYTVFKNKTFRVAAFGYFGHMWELYAFWTFVPTIIITYNLIHSAAAINVPISSFAIIAIGSFSCVLSGYISQHFSTKKVASSTLFLSCLCCLISPFIFAINSPEFFLLFLLFWGMVVIADSPLFSTLIAQNVDAETKGTALTIVNCIGFSVTIISIQLLTLLKNSISPTLIYLFLAIGPVLGLISLFQQKKEPTNFVN